MITVNDLPRTSTSANPSVSRPINVPADRVVDFDMYHPPGSEEDVHLAWKVLHNGPDIVWTPHYGGHWIVTRAEDVEFLQKNHDPFSMKSVSIPSDPRRIRILPLECDPPEHTGYRAIVSPWFTPKAIASLGDTTRTLAINLIEGFRPRGECEFIHEFAQDLPIAIFCKLTNVPFEDKDMLLEWTEWSTRGTPEQRYAAFQKMTTYIESLVAARRANPGSDIISDVVRAQVDGKLLSSTDILSMLLTILFGGLDTVASSMGFLMRFLAQNSTHCKQLAENPALIPAAIEELMRRFAVSNTARTLTRNYEYKGIQFKEGDKVLVPPLLGNLDERRFEKPLEVDFQRKTISHFGFGNGPHRCPGSFLARTEMKVFMEEWFKRIPEFEVKPGAKVVIESGMVHGVHRLPLVWAV